ncbi:NAD-dependent succinate-semialdehyde dehydrogenase [Fibrella sp. HMF5335]|uniref:NAD-dependent succinate-semialdehyde dehydrogenase n=1 Tax=Fibrella rubiginis TaxID=2817060 RepID=A0A939K386_9BACT|nr:NAD-dependent succinate-semialdehyde dehydrogenase [Fibrella rubiginis]MBO0935378.1 NAD-dependent succinate-semialdehyde dehydrogenase [Fibrella rubiginis]
MIFQTTNPYTGEHLAQYPAYTNADIETRLERAATQFADWSMRSFPYRSDCFRRLAVVLRQKQEQLALLMTHEMGKILTESRGEIEKCAAQCEHYATHAEAFLRPEAIDTEAQMSGISYEPVGVVLGIMPWNFPFWQVFRYAVPALMAGNVTLLKPAPNTLGCGLAIENAFREAGFPDGVFACLPVDVPALQPIIADNRINMITLTGSERAGSSVAQLAGASIKKCVLELGGSDPLLVLADADLEAAAKAAVTSRMSNAGQVCIAAKRWLVEAAVADDFTHRVTDLIRAIRQGNPLDPAIQMGPIARLDLADTLRKQLAAARQQGAELLVGGQGEGTLFAPTLLRNVQADNIAFREETFGPIAAITTVRDAADAVRLANESRYGLSATIWTADLDRAAQVARQLQVGSVFVNAVVRSDARLPIGGVKKSGYGRELAHTGIREFCATKTLYVA